MAAKRRQDELDPLREMCRAGRLFDVQEWVRRGNPVVLKELPPPGHRKHNPLRIALDRGFHSLVQVLLEAGAPIEEGNYHALYHAVEIGRHDLIELLFDHGADANDISLQHVIATWDGKLVKRFVSKGASLIEDNPIAWGLVNKIRTALGVFKHYQREHPELKEQVNIALRYHAREGNPKWVALALWAGADPWARGPEDAPDCIDTQRLQEEQEYDYSAMELAVLHGRRDVLQVKGMLRNPDPNRPETLGILNKIWLHDDLPVLELLLEHGHSPSTCEDKCSHLITQLLCRMGRGLFDSSRWRSQKERDVDTYAAKDHLRMVELLVSHGAIWKPESKQDVVHARQRLIQMKAKYTVQFVELMRDHQAARRRDMEELLRTASIQEVVAKKRKHLANLVAGLPDELSM